MQKFSFVEPVQLVSIDGTQRLDAKGVVETWTHLQFLYSRLGDPAFAEGKEGIDAVAFAVVTRLELEQQESFAKKRGFWLLEDDRALALQRATLLPRVAYNLHLAVPISQLAAPLKTLEPYKPEPVAAALEPS